MPHKLTSIKVNTWDSGVLVYRRYDETNHIYMPRKLISIEVNTWTTGVLVYRRYDEPNHIYLEHVVFIVGRYISTRLRETTPTKSTRNIIEKAGIQYLVRHPIA